MSFQAPITVDTVLKRVHQNAYVLPAIQREFIWDTAQTCLLFDSLLRGYPIGSFLFWSVSPDTALKFTFYQFLRHYHEKETPYAPSMTIPPGQGVVAILDGQQRLTALNIGLYGSHAERVPYKWARNPDAYPKKHLYVDLLGEGLEEELGMHDGQYHFKEGAWRHPLLASQSEERFLFVEVDAGLEVQRDPSDGDMQAPDNDELESSRVDCVRDSSRSVR